VLWLIYKIHGQSKIYSMGATLELGSQIYTRGATPLTRPLAENFYIPEKSTL